MNLEAARTELARIKLSVAALEGLLSAPVTQPPEPAPAPPPALVRGLSDPAAFFGSVRGSKALGPSLTEGEVKGCEAILEACEGFPVSWTAYCLATAVVETAGTMQPIKEYGGPAYFRRMYDIEGERPAKARELGNLTPGDGARYAGRGYVQLTGRANYERAGRELGLPLVADPDIAMQPDIAARIMREGMRGGWFTGKSLSTYLLADGDLKSFTAARKIINGTDRAGEIAGYAMEFQGALRAGGWQ